MAFRYNSEDASNAWPEGEYDGAIASAEETQSRKGADMLKLGVRVYNKEGQEKIVTDYIVNPSGLFKLEQIARAFGKGAEFKANKFDVFTVLEKRLTITLKVTEASGDFPEKNDVKKYAASASAKAARPAAPEPGSMKDEMKRRETVGAESPLSSDEQFKDSEIPFNSAHTRVR